MNSNSVNYFMIGGPFHGQEVPLPHPVEDYSPIVDGAKERYEKADVNLFGRRLTVLVHITQKGSEQRTNDALAHGLLTHAAIYQVWTQAPPSFPPKDDSLPSVGLPSNGADDTRHELPQVETSH